MLLLTLGRSSTKEDSGGRLLSKACTSDSGASSSSCWSRHRKFRGERELSRETSLGDVRMDCVPVGVPVWFSIERDATCVLDPLGWTAFAVDAATILSVAGAPLLRSSPPLCQRGVAHDRGVQSVNVETPLATPLQESTRCVCIRVVTLKHRVIAKKHKARVRTRCCRTPKQSNERGVDQTATDTPMNTRNLRHVSYQDIVKIQQQCRGGIIRCSRAVVQYHSQAVYCSQYARIGQPKRQCFSLFLSLSLSLSRSLALSLSRSLSFSLSRSLARSALLLCIFMQ